MNGGWKWYGIKSKKLGLSPEVPSFFVFFITLGLELSDSKVHEP